MELVPLLIAFIGGGGLSGAIVALLKVRAESGQIVVSAAQGAVVVQSTVIDDLQEELDRQRGKYKEQADLLQDAFNQIESLRDEVKKERAERQAVIAEKSALEEKVKTIEGKIDGMINGEIPNRGGSEA
jgi:hypothetical protein